MLSEFQMLNEVFQRLAERWHVSAPDYVWRGYAGGDFSASDHGRALAVLQHLREAVGDLASQASIVAGAAGVASAAASRA